MWYYSVSHCFFQLILGQCFISIPPKNIRKSELHIDNLWQWSLQEIELNQFCWLGIPQKNSLAQHRTQNNFLPSLYSKKLHWGRGCLQQHHNKTKWEVETMLKSNCHQSEIKKLKSNGSKIFWILLIACSWFFLNCTDLSQIPWMFWYFIRLIIKFHSTDIEIWQYFPSQENIYPTGHEA